MQIYVVGGAVRDVLLSRIPKDLDYVVVGSTPEEMLAEGFTQVGADFPVFLSADGDEYALARTERKKGTGYNGFEVDASSTITLEEDLFRRDLTINAMAVYLDDWDEFQDTMDHKLLVDPYNGALHLEHGYLAPVSEHFDEDPVRCLRAARFGARYNFECTQLLAQRMYNLVESGELDSLVGERVWAEFEKAMGEAVPSVFFEILAHVGAYNVIFKHIQAEKIQLMLPVINALVTPRSRIAAWSCMASREEIEKQFEVINAPTDFLKFALVINDLLQVPPGGRTMAERMYDLNASVVKDDWIEDLCAVMNMMGSRMLGGMAYHLPAVRNIVNHTNFEDLPVDVQKSAKGPEIGKAIKKLRIMLIDNYLDTHHG